MHEIRRTGSRLATQNIYAGYSIRTWLVMEPRGRKLIVRHRFEARNLDGKSIWDVPDSWGVYILRDRKFNVSFVGSTPALRTKLFRHFQTQDIPDATYFECYQVENERDAIELLEEIKRGKRVVS